MFIPIPTILSLLLNPMLTA
jgi:predicted MFS family arabinose efflux permease